jgi:cation diffusion facilitator CzcD-associated flavoprotein CzcO
MDETTGANPHLDVVVVGAGFGGLCMAIKLREAGIENFVVLEKANEVGGTWRDNHYPGAACDVQSHMYSYSFYGKPDWSHRYAPWEEIQSYILEVTGAYDLRRFIRFGQEVIAARFDERRGLWTLETRAGDTLVTRHWVLATGPLHVPAIPDLPGLGTFKGKVFHSARWDHDYDLRGKNVVSIGTGGSAIQYVPEVAKEVKQLYVFQRSAAWVLPRDERRYSRLRKRLFALVPALRKMHRAGLYWRNESRVWPIFHPRIARAAQKALSLFIRYQVRDPELRRKLTPDYTLGCKRVLISNVYFPTFNRANVELVTDPIAEVREHGVVTRDGKEYHADCIVLGTGFIVDPRIYMKDFVLTGRAGRSLAEDWKREPTAHMGICVAGYPNMFQLVGPHTGLGHNSILFMIESQVRYIVECIQRLKQRGADYVEVRQDVQDAFLREVQEHLAGTVWSTGCRSWYQTAEGINFAIWPMSTWRYWLRTRHVEPSEYLWVTAHAERAEPPLRLASAGGHAVFKPSSSRASTPTR